MKRPHPAQLTFFVLPAPQPSPFAKLLDHHRTEIAKAERSQIGERRRAFVRAVTDELRRELGE